MDSSKNSSDAVAVGCVVVLFFFLFVGVMSCNDISTPAHQERWRQSDSLRQIAALRADSVRKVQEQRQLRKTMESGYKDSKGYIVAEVEELSRETETSYEGSITSILFHTRGKAGKKETVCYLVDTDQGLFYMYRKGKYTLPKAGHYYRKLEKGKKYRFRVSGIGGIFDDRMSIDDIKTMDNTPL